MWFSHVGVEKARMRAHPVEEEIERCSELAPLPDNEKAAWRASSRQVTGPQMGKDLNSRNNQVTYALGNCVNLYIYIFVLNNIEWQWRDEVW